MENKLTYEDYIKTVEDISKNLLEIYPSKEKYNETMKFFEIIEGKHNEIENLVEHYFNVDKEETLSKEYFKRVAYYDIIEYCFKKIKESDEILKKNLGFSGYPAKKN